MITITEGDVERLLTEAVEARGANYTYKETHTACVYVDLIDREDEEIDPTLKPSDEELRPSCIVGDVLIRAGVPKSALYNFHDVDAPALLNCSMSWKTTFLASWQMGVDDYIEWAADARIDPQLDQSVVLGLVDVTPFAVRMLTVAQKVQDAGYSWGLALEAARTVLALVRNQ